jgi:hypothetical protein
MSLLDSRGPCSGEGPISYSPSSVRTRCFDLKLVVELRSSLSLFEVLFLSIFILFFYSVTFCTHCKLFCICMQLPVSTNNGHHHHLTLYIVNAHTLQISIHIISFKKAVPPHATEALGWRRGIVPTHSLPRHHMGVSGQRHAPAAY